MPRILYTLCFAMGLVISPDAMLSKEDESHLALTLILADLQSHIYSRPSNPNTEHFSTDHVYDEESVGVDLSFTSGITEHVSNVFGFNHLIFRGKPHQQSDLNRVAPDDLRLTAFYTGLVFHLPLKPWLELFVSPMVGLSHLPNMNHKVFDSNNTLLANEKAFRGGNKPYVAASAGFHSFIGADKWRLKMALVWRDYGQYTGFRTGGRTLGTQNINLEVQSADISFTRHF